MRSAGTDLLSLALMDARNRTLGWLAAFEGLEPGAAPDGFDPPWWLAGQAGWFQEYWIARHVQRAQGAAADPTGLRLASVEPQADAWFAPAACTPAQRWSPAYPQTAPDLEAVRGYLAATLDTTLDLLAKAGPGDDALFVFRRALMHEDLLGESLAGLVQGLNLSPERHQPLVDRGLWPALPGRAGRDAIGVAGQSFQLGSAPGGWVPDTEYWAHPVQVSPFEIDAQPVNWSQFAEFVVDGGYDERGWWSPAGWAWVQAGGRRAPRYVEQVAGAVLAHRQGRVQRLPAAQVALHLSAHEADAWCCWAGRRLPSEAEWALAATLASARGFAWGEVLEWVAGTARPYPGAGDALAPVVPGQRVLRGASAWASARLRHAQARRYVLSGTDVLFAGFRSCAL